MCQILFIKDSGAALTNLAKRYDEQKDETFWSKTGKLKVVAFAFVNHIVMERRAAYL